MLWLCLALLTGPACPVSPQAPTALVDTAIARMGGADRLRGIQRTRFEVMTQWLQTSFSPRTQPEVLAYEFHSDLRDYRLGGWRNTRRYPPAPADRDVIDVVVDSVAARYLGGSWRTLSGAYLDERRELFAFAPERLLLAARAATDLRALPDTTVDGERLARLGATVDGFPSELLFRRGDGFLAAVRYQAAQPWDFGLAGWGVMDVAIRYGRWRSLPGGITYPTQFDVSRVGVPYKRMTYLATRLDAPATPDSFAVSDSLRADFWATARRPMFDLALDSARVVETHWVDFKTFGSPAGAVRLGGAWLVLESGVAPLSADRALAWLGQAAPGTAVAQAIVTTPGMTAAGGTARLLARGVPVLAGPSAAPFAAKIVAGQHGTGSPTAVARGRWLRIGSDSVRIEPIDLPDAAGSVMIYSPTLRWLYSGAAASPLAREFMLARARQLGWRLDSYGSSRSIWTAVVPVTAAAP